MPAATATLSDSAPCARGIATRCAATALSCGRIPAPSLPTITAMGPSPRPSSAFTIARWSGTPSAAAAHSVTVSFRAQAMKPASSSGTTGWRKVAPIAARSALGLVGSAVPRNTTVPAAPSACAVRINVPTFPGSCTPSITSATAPGRGANSAAAQRRGSITAMMPCGVSVSASCANVRAPISSTGTACRSSSATSSTPRAVRARSGATRAPWNVRPAASASSTSRTPSIRASPRRPRALRRWRSRIVDGKLRAMDLPPGAVKSGMLASAVLVETVADGIARHRLPNYVLDPVMVATSGDRLLDEDAEQLVARRLLPLAALVTPNLDETAILVGEVVATPDAMERAGRALVRRGARAALVKGGHLSGDQVVDVLVTAGAARRFTRPRLDTTSTHGTGCTLSAAVAAGLALGRPLEQAVADGPDFLHRALAAAPGGGGGRVHGPCTYCVPAPPRPPTEGL